MTGFPRGAARKGTVAHSANAPAKGIAEIARLIEDRSQVVLGG